MRVSGRFSLRTLLVLSNFAMLSVTLCFYAVDRESDAERAIRIQGPSVERLSLDRRVDLLEKAHQRADIGELLDRGRPVNEPIPAIDPVEYAQLAYHFRKQFPFRSLRRRLRIERRARMLHYRLTQSTRLRMERLEDPTRGGTVKWIPWPPRVDSLHALHNEHVFDFISQDGAGFSRMRTPSVNYLYLEEAPLVAIGDVDPHPKGQGKAVALRAREPSFQVLKHIEQASEMIAAHAATPQKRVAPAPIDPMKNAYLRWSQKQNPSFLPSHERLEKVFEIDRMAFAESGRNGYAKNVDQVAGFMHHALDRAPALQMTDLHPAFSFRPYKTIKSDRGARIRVLNQRTARRKRGIWQLRRLQLVSLLKHDRALVYASQYLPNMRHLKDVPMRDLDAFEKDSLRRLLSGEDVVIKSHQNQIRMLGSMRTLKQCQVCHGTDRGELLGAFTYEFVRSPLPVEQHLAMVEN